MNNVIVFVPGCINKGHQLCKTFQDYELALQNISDYCEAPFREDCGSLQGQVGAHPRRQQVLLQQVRVENCVQAKRKGQKKIWSRALRSRTQFWSYIACDTRQVFHIFKNYRNFLQHPLRLVHYNTSISF